MSCLLDLKPLVSICSCCLMAGCIIFMAGWSKSSLLQAVNRDHITQLRRKNTMEQCLRRWLCCPSDCAAGQVLVWADVLRKAWDYWNFMTDVAKQEEFAPCWREHTIVFIQQKVTLLKENIPYCLWGISARLLQPGMFPRALLEFFGLCSGSLFSRNVWF